MLPISVGSTSPSAFSSQPRYLTLTHFMITIAAFVCVDVYFNCCEVHSEIVGVPLTSVQMSMRIGISIQQCVHVFLFSPKLIVQVAQYKGLSRFLSAPLLLIVRAKASSSGYPTPHHFPSRLPHLSC